MAKTIKELAEKILEENKDEIVSVYDRYAGIVDGANAVLEAVEGCMYDKEYILYFEGTPYIDGKEFYNRLVNLIKQLKGE